MDIITHAGIGLIAAAPVLNSRPELALGLVAGSVLPDLDALGRAFGKRAFLRSHQTWSHAIPVQGALSVLAGVLASAFGADGLLLGAGLFVGLVIHTLLDFSNTLGVTLLAPFSRKRFCLEWVFFIDAFVLTLTFIMAVISLWLFYRNGDVPIRYASIFFGTMVTYFGAKGLLRRRTGVLSGLDQQPAQRICFVTFIKVALIARQLHDLTQLFEGQVLGGLVKCMDEFSRLDIAASRFE